MVTTELYSFSQVLRRAVRACNIFSAHNHEGCWSLTPLDFYKHLKGVDLEGRRSCSVQYIMDKRFV